MVKAVTAVAATVVLFAGFCAALFYANKMLGWPSDEMQRIIVLAGLGISVTPVLIFILDFIATSRGSIGYKEFTVDFSAMAAAAKLRVTSLGPLAIGPQSPIVSDSSAAQITETLEQATSVEVVQIDLTGDEPWWVTRLLMLCVGALRKGNPKAIVFVARSENALERNYLAWSTPRAIVEALRDVTRTVHNGPMAVQVGHAYIQGGQTDYVTYGELYDKAEWLATQLPTAQYVASTIVGQMTYLADGPSRYINNDLYIRRGSVVTENILLDQVGMLRLESDDPDVLTISRFSALLDGCVYCDAINLLAPLPSQLEVLNRARGQFIAFTRNKVFENLVDVSMITRYLSVEGAKPESTGT